MAARPRPSYYVDILIVLNRLLGKRVDVTQGNMFGFPAFYTGGKLFACVYGDGVGLKLPEQVIQGLQGKPGITPFRPYGRPKMKEWIHIRPDGAGMSALKSTSGSSKEGWKRGVWPRSSYKNLVLSIGR